MLQLKEVLRRLDLKVSGNKAELIKRLQEESDDMVTPVVEAVLEEAAGMDAEEDDDGSTGQLEVQVRELHADMSVHARNPYNNAHTPLHTLQLSPPVMHAVATSVSTKTVPVQYTVASSTVTQPKAAVVVAQTSTSQPSYLLTQQGSLSTHIRSTAQQVAHAPLYNIPVHQNMTPQTHVDRARERHTLQEIAAILPVYDPCDNDYTSVQFVQRIDQLRELYNWDDSLLIFAVLGKLKGVAKRWADAQPVFREWSEFVSIFLIDFPYVYNAADAHIRLMNSRIGRDEKVIEFYY
ncbi:uncharacterized protein LOC125778803 isoform X2 [Bactrocera dorsalis]|uniref:Uncharacterized protein LOC125778803 isoform X2 n=1 Tax=Bactrocera dorsalis TaxID=27457 RepID=A0ABM3JXW4_BACDO|nr:uncharacterized protein LOC125778803 isoform X2 [Bactrocera dorsalis]